MTTNRQADFFQSLALDFWRLAIPEEQTKREAIFLQRIFGATRPGRLLDVPCGEGRHAIELAKQGYNVTGVDSSEESIAAGRLLSATLPVSWQLSDMRDLAWNNEFDGAFCFGNSFAFLNAGGALDFLRAVYRTLRAGSRFVIETGMTAESILPTVQRTRWMKAGDVYMLSSNQYEPRESRLDTQYTFLRGDKSFTRTASSYVMTLSEIYRLHVEAGLEPTGLFGSIEEEPYQLGSPRLIFVSRKI